MTSIYQLFAMGRIPLNPKLISKGYGGSIGGACERCHKPLKYYPVFNGRLCGLCYTPKKERQSEP